MKPYTKDYNMNTTKPNQITELKQLDWSTKTELIKVAQKSKLNSMIILN